MITKSEVRQKLQAKKCVFPNTTTNGRHKLHAKKYVFPPYKAPREVLSIPGGDWEAEQVEKTWFKKIEAYFRLDLERRASSSMLEAYVHKNPPDESVHKHSVAEIHMLTVHLKDSKKRHDVNIKFDTPTVLYRQQEGASRRGVVMREGVFTPLGKYLLMSRMKLWEEYEEYRPRFDSDWSDSDSDQDPDEPAPESWTVLSRFLRACETLAAMRPERPRTTRSMTRAGHAAADELTFADFMQMSVSGTITKTSWKRDRKRIEPEWKRSQKDYDTFQEFPIVHLVDEFFADAIAKPTFSKDERERLAKMFA